jgi:dolichyl-phosphate beta-glucosyltransferase
VVIPAYNEAARIGPSLEHVASYLDARGGHWEMVVVDDGSTDQTALVVQRFLAGRAQVRMVRLEQNRGKGAALRAGVAATRGARVLVMDADLAAPIEDLELLWRALDTGVKVAVGSRAVSTSNIRRWQSPLRVFFGRAGNVWIRALAVPGVHDTQCGFKLFEGDIGRQLFGAAREDRFGIDIEVLCRARRQLGLEIAEVGVNWEHRDGSKVRLRDYVDVFLKVPRIVYSVLRSQ